MTAGLSGVVYYGWRYAAVEHVLDVVDPKVERAAAQGFVELVNDRAQWFRLWVRLEGTRFVSGTSEHLHETVVRPALLLLADPMLAAVDQRYREVLARALSIDAGGAIAAAITSWRPC